MARINLLPWRDERRKEQQRQFVTILGLSVVLMILVLAAIHLQYAREISVQNSRNSFLKRHIAEVDEQIKELKQLESDKKRLLARIEKVQILQHNRPEIVHLFDEIVRIIPDGVYLTKLQQNSTRLTIEGSAQSNARVSAFMRGMDKSEWFTSPVLEVIRADKKTSNERDFKLLVTQVTRSLTDKDDAKGKKKTKRKGR